MLKVTKTEIKDILKNARKPHAFNLKLDDVYVYIFNNSINYHIHYCGQGIDGIIYNNQYDSMVKIGEYANRKEYTLKEATDLAYKKVKEMKENYIQEHNKMKVSDIRSWGGLMSFNNEQTENNKLYTKTQLKNLFNKKPMKDTTPVEAYIYNQTHGGHKYYDLFKIEQTMDIKSRRIG